VLEAVVVAAPTLKQALRVGRHLDENVPHLEENQIAAGGVVIEAVVVVVAAGVVTWRRLLAVEADATELVGVAAVDFPSDFAEHCELAAIRQAWPQRLAHGLPPFSQ